MRRIQNLIILVLVISVACHAVAICLFYFDPIVPQMYGWFYGMLILSFLGSVVIAFVEGGLPFWVILVSRLVAILLISQVSVLFITVMLLLTLLLETAIFISFPRNLIMGFTCLLVTFGMKLLVNLGQDASLHDFLNSTLLCFPILSVVIAMSSLVVFYRERYVAESGEKDNLNAVVHNLTQANVGFQQYASKVERESIQEERNRITRELHDGLGYIFTNMKMMMDAARVLVRKGETGDIDEILQNARDQADQGVEETRRTLHMFRETLPPDLSGIRAIQNLVNIFVRSTQTEVRTHYGNMPWTLGRHIDATIYRLVQEGLINAVRHGKATAIDLKFWLNDSELNMYVRDNGIGVSEIKEGIGMVGMRERVRKLGGSVRAHNVEGGFELAVMIPYKMSISY